MAEPLSRSNSRVAPQEEGRANKEKQKEEKSLGVFPLLCTPVDPSR